MSRSKISSFRIEVLLNQIRTTPALQPAEWHQRAEQAFQNGQYRSCIDLLNKAIDRSEHQPADGRFDRQAAIHLRSRAHRSLGQYLAAIVDLQQLLEQDSLNPEIYLELAPLLVANNREAAAAELLTKGIQRVARDQAVPLFLERGKIAARAGDYLAAIDDFSVAIYHQPKRAEGWYQRGLLKTEIRSFRNAIHDGQQATLIEPNDYSAHYAFSRILCRAGRYRDALLPLSRAIELAPDISAPVSLLGRALVLLERHREARVFLDKAIEMGASDPATLQARRRVAYTLSPKQEKPPWPAFDEKAQSHPIEFG